MTATSAVAVAGVDSLPGDASPSTRFFTNHAHVLMCLAEDPGMRIRDIAARVGVRDRAVTRILRDLEADGCVVRSRVGRRSHYFVVPDPPLAHPLERHLSLEPLISAVRTPAAAHAADDRRLRVADRDASTPLDECRELLAAEAAAGWPTLGPALADAYGPDWRPHVDAAATTLVRHGRTQRGHEGTELVFLSPRPWRTLVATFVDGKPVALSVEDVGTVVDRARRGMLIGADRVPAAVWDGPLTTEPGLLGVALVGEAHWVVVDHTGARVLASSAWPDAGAGDDDGDPDGVPFAVVRQPVRGRGVVPVGCRQQGLAYDLTRRHPLVLVGAPLGPATGRG